MRGKASCSTPVADRTGLCAAVHLGTIPVQLLRTGTGVGHVVEHHPGSGRSAGFHEGRVAAPVVVEPLVVRPVHVDAHVVADGPQFVPAGARVVVPPRLERYRRRISILPGDGDVIRTAVELGRLARQFSGGRGEGHARSRPVPVITGGVLVPPGIVVDGLLEVVDAEIPVAPDVLRPVGGIRRGLTRGGVAVVDVERRVRRVGKRGGLEVQLPRVGRRVVEDHLARHLRLAVILGDADVATVGFNVRVEPGRKIRKIDVHREVGQVRIDLAVLHGHFHAVAPITRSLIPGDRGGRAGARGW